MLAVQWFSVFVHLQEMHRHFFATAVVVSYNCFTTLEVSGLGKILNSCLERTCWFLVCFHAVLHWCTYSYCSARYNLNGKWVVAFFV